MAVHVVAEGSNFRLGRLGLAGLQAAAQQPLDDADRQRAVGGDPLRNLSGAIKQGVVGNMDIVMGVSDVITVMQSGRVLVEGKPEAIRNDPRVRAAYLGSMLTGGR